MATTITQFTGGHNGSGGAPVDREDTVAIGGSAGAGEWLQVITVGGADGSGLDQTILSDDVSGTTGWIEDFDFIEGAGSDAIRVIGWRKQTVGGETEIVATWPGACNHATVGCWAHDLTQPIMYLIDAGGALFDPPFMRFTAGPPLIQTDHETYVASMGFGRAGASLANFESPPSPPAEGGVGTVISSAVGAISHYNDDESTNSTADTLTYQLQPTQSAVMCWYGFTDEEPAVLLFGEGELLLGGSGELAVTEGDLDLVGTGRLILGGTGHLAQEGGGQGLSGVGRVIGGGRGRLFTDTPFPQPIRVPEDHLGCGVYQAFAFTRGLGEIVTMLPFTDLAWARILDETSDATLTIDGVANPRAIARCCAALSELEPAEHELAIYRNGWRVWSGPITDMTFPAEQCVIQASDLSWWLTQRTIHQNINSVQIDLVNILVAYVQDAMSVENSAGLTTAVLALAGQLGDRLVQQKDHQLAADVIGELARSGVDWTQLDRRMLLGPLQPQPAPYPGATPYPTLIDANFRVQPTITVSGSQGANTWYVNGPTNGAGDLIFGEYGPAFPATPDHVAQPAAPDYAEIEDQYGRLERVVTESRILDQAGIDFNAQTRYDLLKRPLVYISEGALLPSTPIPIEKLLPGSLVNVHLSNVCRVIGEPYRIKQVAVQAHSDGSESVDVQWQPLGTGETL